MRLLDLFAGIGGFSLAAHWMGWETAAFVERDKFCHKVLRKNFGEDIEIYDDITTFSGKPFRGSIDIVTGGFPCQPYSSAGQRKGQEDERHLWPEMLRVIVEVQPRFIVGENVLGLISWERGMVFDQVQADLEAEGFEITSFVLPACAVDAPHRRDRVWFVAHSKQGGWTSRQQNFSTQRGTLGNGILPHGVCDGADTESQRPGFTTNWEVDIKTSICRKDDGLSSWMDRIGALGNSIVPQIAYELFRAIAEVEKENR